MVGGAAAALRLSCGGIQAAARVLWNGIFFTKTREGKVIY
jgi:hypothetical protein